MTTSIEWVRNPDGSKGEVWNPISGCSAISEGCRNCFAARMAATRLKHHPRYEGLATIENGKARWTGEIRLNHDVLEQPLRWRKPRRVFVCSMSDLFHEGIPAPEQVGIWSIMRDAPQHTFQVLTKRASRMQRIVSIISSRQDFGILPNVWLGVSIENQAAAEERISWLLRTPAAVHYVSVEPCLSAIDLTPYLPQACAVHNCVHRGGRDCLRPRDDQPTCLDWVICGGESGPGARPMHPDWARSLRDQCQAASVPFFFKQWGEWMGMDYTGARIAGDGAECFRWSGVPMPPFLPGESIGKNHRFDQSFGASRIGKKRAGHLLDGRVWQEFPK